MESQATAAQAAPEDGAASASPESKRNGKAGLLKRRPLRTKWVEMPDGEEQLLGALTPKEIAEINERTVSYEDDGQKTVISPMRVFYMIARSLREPDGKRMFSSREGADTAYVLGAEQLATQLRQDEIDVLRDAVFDISGLSAKARDKAGKESGPTRI